MDLIEKFLLLVIIAVKIVHAAKTTSESTIDDDITVYFGSSEVDVGKSFEIYCIVTLSDPIEWLKDDKPITRHNLRHGNSDHAYVIREKKVEGKTNKIEAVLSVKHALKGHEGKYQCNRVHSNYHMLKVVSNEKLTTPIVLETMYYSPIPSNVNFVNESFSLFDEIQNESPEKDEKIETSKIVKPTILVPNYDNEEHELKVFITRQQLLLRCNVTIQTDDELVWEKDGIDVSKITEPKDHYKIIGPERILFIKRTTENDNGTYSCSLNEHKRNINVVAQVEVRVSSGTGTVEGETLSIRCTVAGTDPTISWEFGDTPIEKSNDKYLLKSNEQKIDNAMLVINNITKDDAGEYKCIVENLATKFITKNKIIGTTVVRVKGKYAAVWPFIGIVLEIIILAIIIIVHESRKKKDANPDND